MYEHIPYELKELNNWCVFRIEETGTGRTTKRPYHPISNQLAKSNDPDTWVSFEEAVSRVSDYDGIGFFFTEPYIGVDLDSVENEIKEYTQDPDVDNIVSEFIESLQSYAEISPSGSGVHIIVKGELPHKGRRRGDVEIYDKGRFFTMTGNHIGGYRGISDDDYGKLGYLHNKYILVRETENEENQSKGFGNDVSPGELINFAKKSKNGQRFTILFDGGWEQFYSSQSEADMALVNDLAFWTARDPVKMDKMFRMSSLMRDKWDGKRGASTYGAQTIAKAIESCQNEFVPTSDEPMFVIENVDTKPVNKKKKKFYSYDDTGNAERIVDNFGEYILYNYSRSNWMYYKSGVWHFDEKGKTKLIADKISDIIKKEPVFYDAESEIAEEEAKKSKLRHLKNSRSKSGKENMLSEARHLLPAVSEDFDKDKFLFNVQNGYLDLNTGELHDHDKSKMFTRISEVEFTTNSDSPNWDKFLHEISCGRKDWIDYMQRLIGYSLSGSTKEQKMFVLLGNGRNGKSVFINILNKIFGNYAMNITPQAIMTSHNKGNATPEIAKLDGARLVTTTEPNEGDRFDEGLIKQITGGDKINARFLHQNDFEYIPQFKLFMATNHKPFIRGTDEGIWRRMVIIPFELELAKSDINYNLQKELEKESSAILNWAVDGYIKYLKHGLDEPDCIRSERDEYRTEMDSISAFLQECTIERDGEREKSSDLFDAYNNWATKNNQYKMSSTKFGRELKKKLKFIRSNGAFYLNVKLLDEYKQFEFKLKNY